MEKEFIAIKSAQLKPIFSFLYSLPTKYIVIMLKIEGITDDILREISVSGKKNSQNFMYR